MTQLLDTAGPYACIWDEGLECSVEPLINPHISEADKLCFALGCDAPPRELSAPIPIPAGGLLLATALAAILIYRRFQ